MGLRHIVATRQNFREAVGRSEPGYRKLGEKKHDLKSIDQKRMLELAAQLWERSGLAKQLIELPVAFLLGEGVLLTAEDAEAQEWLDEFWFDPINRLDLNLQSHLRELSLFGELILPVFRNEVTGTVRLGKIDPAEIDAIITDPDNAAVPIGIRIRKAAGKAEDFRIIYNGTDEELFAEPARELRAEMASECFFWRINNLSTGTRGRSDILYAIDMADSYEELVFGELDGAQAKRAVVWDVELKNATDEEIAAKAKEIQPPGPNYLRLHNEGEVWNVHTPDLKAGDADTIARLARNHILSGSAVPEHWFGGGGDVNLATASSMGEPTYKIFSQRQRLIKAMLEAIGTYVIRSRLRAYGLLAMISERGFETTATFPELTARDIARYATAFQQVVVSVTQALTAGVMSEATAVEMLTMMAALMGLEVDPVAELQQARAEAAARRERDAFALPMPQPDLSAFTQPTPQADPVTRDG